MSNATTANTRSPSPSWADRSQPHIISEPCTHGERCVYPRCRAEGCDKAVAGGALTSSSTLQLIPHADLIREVLDGKQVQEQDRQGGWHDFVSSNAAIHALTREPVESKFRVKPHARGAECGLGQQ